jgi:hypothetical protein
MRSRFYNHWATCYEYTKCTYRIAVGKMRSSITYGHMPSMSKERWGFKIPWFHIDNDTALVAVALALSHGP